MVAERIMKCIHEMREEEKKNRERRRIRSTCSTVCVARCKVTRYYNFIWPKNPRVFMIMMHHAHALLERKAGYNLNEQLSTKMSPFSLIKIGIDLGLNQGPYCYCEYALRLRHRPIHYCVLVFYFLSSLGT